MIILKDDAEIDNVNITDPGTTSHTFGGLKKDTNYTVKVFSRNYVYEGPAAVTTMKTVFEGIKQSKIKISVVIKSKNILRIYFPMLRHVIVWLRTQAGLVTNMPNINSPFCLFNLICYLSAHSIYK